MLLLDSHSALACIFKVAYVLLHFCKENETNYWSYYLIRFLKGIPYAAPEKNTI